MPGAVLGAAIAAGFGGISAAIAGTSILTGALIAGGMSLLSGGLSALLAPDPPKQEFSVAQTSSLTRQVRQPITERRLIYGEVRASGPLVFIGSTNSNRYLHLVIAVASHEINKMGEVFINDVSVPEDYLDGSGNVITGTYSGKVRIKKHLGADSQTADSDLVAEIAEWTSFHRLRGIAYIYVRLEWSRELWPGGIPQISVWVKGKEILDVRDSTTKWSPNLALIVNDYLTWTKYGIGVDQANVDEVQLEASANSCEEIVSTLERDMIVSDVDVSGNIFTLESESGILELQTGDRVLPISSISLPGGISSTDYYIIVYQRKDSCRVKLATSYENALSETAVNITDEGSGTITLRKTGEPRYAGGAIVKTDQKPDKILTEMCSGMAGNLIKAGGYWRIKAGYYETPTISLDEDDFAGPISVQTRQSKRDRFNRVQGVYASPLNLGQPTDYPAYDNTTRQTADDEIIPKEMNLPWTPRSQTCQRLAKIASRRMEQEIMVNSTFSISAFKVQAGDNVFLSFERYGWVLKPFEVMEWQLSVAEEEGVPTPKINLVLKETASDIYDFDETTEETGGDSAPNTNLPSIYNVLAVEGFALDSRAIETFEADQLFLVAASWTQSEDLFVQSGGKLELQYKNSGDSEWRPSFFVDADLTQSDVLQASLNQNYDIRIRNVNYYLIPSPWQTITGFVVGTSGGVTETDDWRFFTESVDDSEDWLLFSDSVTETEDWGAFS